MDHSDSVKKINLHISGMRCASCAALIERELKKVPGIQEAQVDFATKKVLLSLEEEKVTESDIQQAVGMAGDYQIFDLNRV